MSINILLLEDEPAHVELVQRAFEARGTNYLLSVAGTLAEAREQISSNPPALVIADWLLPDGESIQLVKSEGYAASIPIILMTSHGTEQVAVEAMKAGVLDYIVKSSQTLEDMPHIVERALREWDLITQGKRAEQELLQRVAELEAVNKISTSLRSAATLDEMLPQLLDTTLNLMNLGDGAVWLYHATSDRLEPVIARGVFATAREWIARSGESVIGKVYANSELHHSPDLAIEPLIPAGIAGEFPSGMGGVFLPIKSTSQTVGVMAVAAQAAGFLDASKIHLLTTLSEIAGNAIQRTYLYEQTRSSLRRMAGLRLIDLAISSSFDFRPTLQVILHHAVAEIGVNAATVLKLNPYHQLEVVAWHGFSYQPNTRTVLDLNNSYSGKAILENRLVSIPDILQAKIALRGPTPDTGDLFSAFHAVPLVAKGQIKGALEVFHRQPFYPDADWLEYLQALASQAAIAIDNGELFENLQRSNQELSHAYDATIEGWSYALDLRDGETKDHIRRVVDMTIQFARRVGIAEAELVHIRRGALLHDIGKMGIPDAILHKPGPLTDQEWEIMRKHPLYAYEMLNSVSYLRSALDIPHYHHEYWNGKGYPRRLKGEQIPMKARIFALVDVWDALNSERPYRQAWPVKKIRQYIQELSGEQFDPALVLEFFSMLDAKKGL